MLFFRTSTGPSKIAGNGLFILEPAARGTVVSIDAHDVRILSEEQYKEAQRGGDLVAIRNATRWVGSYFQCPPESRDESYINHSSDPNLLYHCGVFFARRDIAPGEELTVDYSLFLAENDVERFVDSVTGEDVLGKSAADSLLASTAELLRVLFAIM
jgi:hypothetical protein